MSSPWSTWAHCASRSDRGHGRPSCFSKKQQAAGWMQLGVEGVSGDACSLVPEGEFSASPLQRHRRLTLLLGLALKPEETHKRGQVESLGRGQ
jgi:hypothetical protein